uniref:Uncharacterized protein n=1 Tax=Anguilla anguilla TaxID=7936 RepID=A0A0E9Q1P6_ANGAN
MKMYYPVLWILEGTCLFPPSSVQLIFILSAPQVM